MEFDSGDCLVVFLLFDFLEVLGRGIALPVTTSMSREQDEVGSVFLQELHILLEVLLGSISAPVIYSNSNTKSLLSWDTSSLEFSQREAPSQPLFRVVLLCSTVNNGSQGSASGTREDAGSLCSPLCRSLSLLCRLIKPSPYTKLPFLVEVGVGNYVIVLRH